MGGGAGSVGDSRAPRGEARARRTTEEGAGDEEHTKTPLSMAVSDPLMGRGGRYRTHGRESCYYNTPASHNMASPAGANAARQHERLQAQHSSLSPPSSSSSSAQWGEKDKAPLSRTTPGDWVMMEKRPASGYDGDHPPAGRHAGTDSRVDFLSLSLVFPFFLSF